MGPNSVWLIKLKLGGRYGHTQRGLQREHLWRWRWPPIIQAEKRSPDPSLTEPWKKQTMPTPRLPELRDNKFLLFKHPICYRSPSKLIQRIYYRKQVFPAQGVLTEDRNSTDRKFMNSFGMPSLCQKLESDPRAKVSKHFLS